MDKILIVQTRPGIGDMCVHLSSIHKISEKNPDSKIYILTKKSSRAKDIFKDDKNLFEIFYLESLLNKSKLKNLINLKKFISTNKFSKVFIMHYGLRYFLISIFSGVNKIYHYGLLKKNENVSKKIYEMTNKWLEIDSFNSNAKIVLKSKPESINQNKNNIIIGIGSSGPTRRWKNERFAGVIKYLNTKKDFIFYIAAGLQEKNDATKIIKLLPKDIKINSLCDKSVYDCMQIIKYSKMYVGTDSAFMHLSAGLGVKSFGLFGDTPTNYSEYSNLIEPIIPEGYTNIGHDSKAMNDITIEKVCNKVENFIN